MMKKSKIFSFGRRSSVVGWSVDLLLEVKNG